MKRSNKCTHKQHTRNDKDVSMKASQVEKKTQNSNDAQSAELEELRPTKSHATVEQGNALKSKDKKTAAYITDFRGCADAQRRMCAR